MQNTRTISDIHIGNGQEARRLHHPNRQDAKRSSGFDRHAFLKHQFGCDTIVSNREIANREKVEHGFFRSLQNLCDFYNLKVPDTEGKPYPENIAYAFTRVKAEFDKLDTWLYLAVVQTDRHATSIATFKPYSTNDDLYFFHVSHIYHIWKQDKSSELGKLALSLCAFLKQTIGVPFFTHSGTLINNCYEYLKDFLEQEMTFNDECEESMLTPLTQELNSINYAGRELLNELNSISHLENLEQNTKNFRPRDQKEKKLLKVCKQAIKLREEYPCISLMMAIPDYLTDYDSHVLDPYMYISFCWGDMSEWMEYNLDEYLHSFLSECTEKLEPAAPQLFNRKVLAERHNLEMQEKLFSFFDSTAQALYAFYYEL